MPVYFAFSGTETVNGHHLAGAQRIDVAGRHWIVFREEFPETARDLSSQLGVALQHRFGPYGVQGRIVKAADIDDVRQHLAAG